MPLFVLQCVFLCVETTPLVLFDEARISQSLSFLTFTPSPCQYPHQLYLKLCCLSPWHSPHAHSPGPPCGMLYSLRPMEEGHPGTQQEHGHANALADTRKHTHRDKYSCWEPSQPFGRRPVQRRVVLEGLCLERNRKKKFHILHLCCVKRDKIPQHKPALPRTHYPDTGVRSIINHLH